MSVSVRSGPDVAPEVVQIVVSHAERGTRLQIAVRGVLAVFIVGTLLLLPPPDGVAASAVIAAGYVVAVVGLTGWLIRGRPSAIRWGWIGLYVDLLALSSLALIADGSTGQSWTSYVLLGGFFLLPVLSATQLRWRVCLGVVVPTVVIYAVEAVVTREANAEPWASVVLRVLVLAGVGATAVGLSVIQRSRMRAIERLVADRTQLLSDLMVVSDTERRTLAENLHDGALQYILAARMDLEDAQELADPAAFERLDQALTQSSQLLRSTVSELHPAVLTQSGLAAAVGQLARTAADRANVDLVFRTGGWPEDARTTGDLLLYGVARELLANVVKHAAATRVVVELRLSEGWAALVVADDGRGLDPAGLSRKLAQGHIGLDSQRVRLESAGGTLQIGSPLPPLQTTATGAGSTGVADPTGTTVTIQLPVKRLSPAGVVSSETSD